MSQGKNEFHPNLAENSTEVHQDKSTEIASNTIDQIKMVDFAGGSPSMSAGEYLSGDKFVMVAEVWYKFLAQLKDVVGLNN